MKTIVKMVKLSFAEYSVIHTSNSSILIADGNGTDGTLDYRSYLARKVTFIASHCLYPYINIQNIIYV